MPVSPPVYITPTQAPFAGNSYEPNWTDVKSIQAMFDQWYGKGLYINTPISGGIAAMETMHKTK
jgi:hypothetical protein